MPDASRRHGTLVGVATMLASGASNQVGAAFGALAFPALGVFGVVGVRQFVTALTLPWIARPKFRTLRVTDWMLVVGLALSFTAMNWPLYIAIQRLGLGVSTTLEFLGPLAVAICSSRKLLDVACAIVAGGGVLLLTHPEPTSDVFGIAMSLLSAAAWAAYILLNRALGKRLHGAQAASAASIISAVLWLIPMAIYWTVIRHPQFSGLLAAIVCGILASAVPYVADLFTLRRVSVGLFGTFMSVNPVWAALAGLFMLNQHLTFGEWMGITLIIVANVIVTLPRPHHGQPRDVPTTTGAIPLADIKRLQRARGEATPTQRREVR